MPLSALPYGEEAVFSAVRSLQAPSTYIGPTAAAANANARLSAQLNSMLCVSRFAHYVKVIGRDMVGSFKTADEIETQLQGWLTTYVNSQPVGRPRDAGALSSCRRPRHSARAAGPAGRFWLCDPIAAAFPARRRDGVLSPASPI